jgi:hypothetical protein
MRFFPALASRFRYRKIVQCPETAAIARIVIDASPTSAPKFEKKRLIVRNCSLWPKRKGCAEDCLE